MTQKLYQVRLFIGKGNDEDEFIFEYNNKEEFNYLYEANEAFKYAKKTISNRPVMIAIVSLPLDDLGHEDYTIVKKTILSHMCKKN